MDREIKDNTDYGGLWQTGSIFAYWKYLSSVTLQSRYTVDTQYCSNPIYMHRYRTVLMLLLLHPDPIEVWSSLALSRFTEDYWNDLQVSLLNNRTRKVVIFTETAIRSCPGRQLLSKCRQSRWKVSVEEFIFQEFGHNFNKKRTLTLVFFNSLAFFLLFYLH